MHARQRRGLTLIEVIVVITILSLLMTAVGVYAMGVFTTAKHDIAVTDIRVALNALEMFKARRSRYPTSSEGFRAVVDSNLLKKMPKDPWGVELLYTLENGEPIVSSYGADQMTGGTGENEDVSSKNLPD